MNKFDRVITTLILLQTKKVIKAATISERFDVSLRTVYRDIRTLKNAGIPIIGDPGIGYSIMEGYRLPPVMFNDQETAALLTAEKFIGQVTDQATKAHYSNALLKIKAVLRSAEKQSLAVLDDSIIFTERNTQTDKTYLQDLFGSIAAKKVVRIDYKKADGTSSERKVEPIGCNHHLNNWYLVAFCQSRKDYRTFKLDRILQLQVLEEKFTTNHLNIQDYINQQKQDWQAQQQYQLIEVAFQPTFIQFVENRKYYFGFVEQTTKNEVVHMTFLYASLEVMARWLLQFGDQATVIAPLALRNRIKTIATQLYQHYG